MGRDAGDIAIWSGLGAGAEAIVIPEVELNVQEIVDTIKSGYDKGKNQGLIVLAEGAMPAHELISKIQAVDNSFNIREVVLGHIQRGGVPTARDRVIGSRFGAKAVELLAEGASGLCVALTDEEISTNEFNDIFHNLKHEPKLQLYELNKYLI